MAELGIKEFEEFDFISSPGVGNIRGAVEVLRLLDALDERRNLTSIGSLMVKFPIIPRLARMIAAAVMEYPDVLEEVLIAAAFLNDRAPFLLPQGFELEARKAHHSFRHKYGDFVSYLNIFRAFENADDPEKFCDQYYLDFKGMQEIYNVKQQLGEIVSEIGVPVVGGGDFSHYLCAVSKGLIQFVCRRKGKSNYSSTTAYGIKIHPGSVMYRERPEYIVAGEIMRTSQMYAMSVSPLYPGWLKKISPDIYESFVGKVRKPKKKAAAERDFTNFIKIGRETFEIQFLKRNKKVVILPYKKLEHAVRSLDVSRLQDYKGLRGRVLFNGYEILSGVALKRIIEITPKLTLDGHVVEKWPRGVHFDYVRDSFEIVRYIPNLLKPSRTMKSKNKLGFLTLLTDGNGSYWYASYRDFIQALEESVSSLEALIDEDIQILNEQQEKTVNEVYRRLSTMITD